MCTCLESSWYTKWSNVHFIEGGAGVGKTQVAKAIYHSLEKFYSSQPGENPDDIHAIILAPAGMAAYHINGNTICDTQGKLVDLRPVPLSIWVL